MKIKRPEPVGRENGEWRRRKRRNKSHPLGDRRRGDGETVTPIPLHPAGEFLALGSRENPERERERERERGRERERERGRP